MNVTDAAYDTVHKYPGGSASLAPRMGLTAATLRGKVNPNSDRNRLALEEADEMMGKSGDYRILHALAANHGFVVQRVSAPTSGSLIGALLQAAEAKGDLSGLIAEALEDGQITPNEAQAITQRCAEVIAALAQVSQHARAAALRGTHGRD